MGNDLGWAWKGQKSVPKKKKKKKTPPKMTEKFFKDFYQSWDWKRMRYRVLQRYGRKCLCCGATPMDGKRMVVDHIKPLRKFPELRLDFNNLQVLCDDCNRGKRDNHDFRGDWDFQIGTEEEGHIRAIMREDT